jgi:hypothetical protein
MFEIIGLLIAVPAIISLARGRGASPLLAATIAVAGWAFIRFFGAFLLPSGEIRVLLVVFAWAWIGLVALFLRFVVGASRAKADSRWNCSSCRYLNNASSVVCEACQQPYQAA